MLLRCVLLLLLLTLPGVAALAAGPESVSAGDGTLLVRWDADDPGDLGLTAARLSGTLSDTYVEDRVVVEEPKAQDVLERNTGAFLRQQSPLPSGPGDLSLVASEDATILVLPLSGAFEATLSGAPATLRSVREATLERNHAYGGPDDGSGELEGYDYAYRVHDVVAAATRGPTTVEVRGDFLLYLWNVTVLQETPHVSRIHETGAWSTPGTTPLHRTDHHQHALLVVRDGHLRIEAPRGGALYAPELLLHDVELTGARLDAPGLVPSTAGTVRATPSEGRVQFAAVPAPAPTAAPAAAGLSAWLLAPVALAAVAAVPSLLGVGEPARTLRLADDACVPTGWLRRSRAVGYRRLALSAERRHRFRRAAFWMGRAARWARDPESRMQQAIFLRMAGRPAAALRRHRDAQEVFGMEGLVHALNAYEAARAAALLDRTDEALQWLLAAVREEPWLAQRAPFEPDLARLRSLPAFMDVAQAADPDGYLRP